MSQEIDANVEFVKCSADAAYFVHEYGYIQDRHSPGGISPVVRFRLWPAQMRLMWQFMLHRLVVIAWFLWIPTVTEDP